MQQCAVNTAMMIYIERVLLSLHHANKTPLSATDSRALSEWITPLSSRFKQRAGLTDDTVADVKYALHHVLKYAGWNSEDVFLTLSGCVDSLFLIIKTAPQCFTTNRFNSFTQNAKKYSFKDNNVKGSGAIAKLALQDKFTFLQDFHQHHSCQVVLNLPEDSWSGQYNCVCLCSLGKKKNVFH